MGRIARLAYVGIFRMGGRAPHGRARSDARRRRQLVTAAELRPCPDEVGSSPTGLRW